LISIVRRPFVGLLVLVCVAAPRPAAALRSHERPGWMVGVGMGYGRGSLEGLGGSNDYDDGVAPQIHAGRQLGQHLMLGLAYEGWMVELGGVVQDTIGVKFRRSLQNFAFGVTVFPGRPQDATGGLWLRGTVGIGWAGTAANLVYQSEAQHNANRLDEWGVGFSGSAGYEFRIAPNFATGVGASFAGFDIGEKVVDQAGFAALLLYLNTYF
jgi:hypothetical protein